MCVSPDQGLRVSVVTVREHVGEGSCDGRGTACVSTYMTCGVLGACLGRAWGTWAAIERTFMRDLVIVDGWSGVDLDWTLAYSIRLCRWWGIAIASVQLMCNSNFLIALHE